MALSQRATIVRGCSLRPRRASKIKQSQARVLARQVWSVEGAVVLSGGAGSYMKKDVINALPHRPDGPLPRCSLCLSSDRVCNRCQSLLTRLGTRKASFLLCIPAADDAFCSWGVSRALPPLLAPVSVPHSVMTHLGFPTPPTATFHPPSPAMRVAHAQRRTQRAPPSPPPPSSLPIQRRPSVWRSLLPRAHCCSPRRRVAGPTPAPTGRESGSGACHRRQSVHNVSLSPPTAVPHVGCACFYVVLLS